MRYTTYSKLIPELADTINVQALLDQLADFLLQSGFAGLYKLLALPVVPVAVNSGPLYHRRWKRPGTITLHFGEPIPPGLTREEIEAQVHAAINLLNA